MKAIVMERYGPPERLEVRDVPVPAPKPNEVLVRIHAASVNDVDWSLVTGRPFFLIRLLYGFPAPRVRTVGGDIAGRVVAIGAAVTRFTPGDDVYGDLCESGFGAFAEYVCAPERCLVHKPAAMSFEQAASIPQAGMLAVQGLIDVGRIRRGQSVLLNGAGGGVGTLALQIAKQYDAELTVVDKAGKLDMLRALGAHHVVDYRREDFTRSGRQYDLILDTRSTRPPWAYARALKPGGSYVTVGGDTRRLLQLLVPGWLIARSTGKRLTLVGLKPNKDLAYFNDIFTAGTLVPVIDSVFPLARVPEALARFGTGDHHGKIIITMT
jgi:NADPH:quinone reductase-like Zn-dependent oxidoreductase